jgi:hypothetical protein
MIGGGCLGGVLLATPANWELQAALLQKKSRTLSERNCLKTQHQMRCFAGLDKKKSDFAGRILDSFEQ